MDLLKEKHTQYRVIFICLLVFYTVVFLLMVYLNKKGFFADFNRDGSNNFTVFYVLLIVSILNFGKIIYFRNIFLKRIKAVGYEYLSDRFFGISKIIIGLSITPVIIGIFVLLWPHTLIQGVVFFVILSMALYFSYLPYSYWQETAAMIMSQNDENVLNIFCD